MFGYWKSAAASRATGLPISQAEIELLSNRSVYDGVFCARRLKLAGSQLLLAFCLGSVAGTALCVDVESPEIEAGRKLAYDFNKGNCLACHSAPTDKQADTLANIAPPLLRIRGRFPDREQLRARIWDPTVVNPNTVMPPFGKHRILTGAEIDLIIDYLYTL